MDFKEIPQFIAQLGTRTGTAARALEFTILTAARSGEVLAARPDEFDGERRVWTIPATRMKAGREHRVPLSRRAIELASDLCGNSLAEFIFRGEKAGHPLSSTALGMVLRRMKIDNATVHGFRSSFRDWAAECTHYSNEVCEAALAHVIQNKAEAAYRRGDLFDKRRQLMEDWSAYCLGERANVVSFREIA